MRVAVAQKMLQHDEVLELLRGTEDAYLVEKAPQDSYWGCGPNGTGRNMLGLILMEIRESLRQPEPIVALTQYVHEAKQRLPLLGDA